MAESVSSKPQTCRKLLKEYMGSRCRFRGQKLTFKGVDGRDVYNITAPFEDDGGPVIAGRVERRDTEYSEVMFFTEKEGVWEPRKDTGSFKLQDPFYSRIRGELVVGGVEVWSDGKRPGSLRWRTVFYKGRAVNGLEPFAAGPDGMKDIRLTELRDGRIGVFTRPQGEVGGRGRIGFVVLDGLEELSAGVLSKAALIPDQFAEEEWGGANEPRLLKNGLIGVLGHIARYDERGNRHYYSTAFSLNPCTREASPMKIIAARMNFDHGDAKKPDLADVIFSGGLVRTGGGNAVLYVGVSDVEAHRLVIPDPFDEYERC